MAIKSKQKRKKKIRFIRSRSRAVALASCMLWIIALFLPAYVQIGSPDQIIIGADAFLQGLILFLPLMIGMSGLGFAWFSNVIYFIVIVALFRAKHSTLGLSVVSLLMMALPMFAYLPGSIIFGNESNVGAAGVGSAVLVWHASLIVCALLPSMVVFRQWVGQSWEEAEESSSRV